MRFLFAFIFIFSGYIAVFAQKDTVKSVHLDEINIEGGINNKSERDYLKEVSGTSIYAGKKSEIIMMQNINANVAINNAREIFAKIPGINVWESDESGVQLGIAARGLNPGRTNEFNTRQNGYDIAADNLGYPENYYVPTSQALDRIEVVRGAASLQYGTQFGGLLNFVMKKPPKDKEFEFNSKQTGGSFGLWNSFNSIGGTKGKFSYYAFYHHKQGDGWRQNSGYQVNTGYVYLGYAFTEKFKLSLEYTKMVYNMQQPGGLTDALFVINPRSSNRNRNWFTADWNILCLSLDYTISSNTKFNTRIFGFVGNRGSVGNLDLIYKGDFGQERNLLYDNYLNLGIESRLLHHYDIGKFKNTVLVGVRAYRGQTHRRQGNGTSGGDANFNYMHPDSLEGSDFLFPLYNMAFFVENVFRVGQKLSIVPGARFEYINTMADGYYNSNGQLISDNKQRPRSFPLFGIGATYYVNENTEIYGNISQAYRAINFNDIRVVNPNQRVDPNIRDAEGYNADLGYRGHYKNFLNFDVSLYFMAYNRRIGDINRVDSSKFTYEFYQYRTNVADSRSYGLETFGEIDFWKALVPTTKNSLSFYSSVAYINAFYIHTNDPSIRGKDVELAPHWITRFGLTLKYKIFSTAIRYAYTSQQFADAQNTIKSTNPVNGIIPEYSVVDWSSEVKYKRYSLSFGINNLMNLSYFTRRATSYPGPGILPSNPMSFYVTLGITL